MNRPAIQNIRILLSRYYPKTIKSLNIRNFSPLSSTYNTLENDKFRKKYERKFIIKNNNLISTKLCSYSNEINDDDKKKPFSEDVEFKNVLKDLADDFKVDEKSAEILNNIRKNQDSPTPVAEPTDKQAKPSSFSKSILSKFKEFEDKDAQVVYSYEEEMHIDYDKDSYHIDREQDVSDVMKEVKRGITGVFDIEELVDVLRAEKLYDIAVIEIPASFHYVDYMVLANAKSLRHSVGVLEYIKKLYKRKKSKKDPFVKVEGEKLGPWKAVDMGNIVLHIFLRDTRICYDIESLWLLDKEYDSGGKGLEEEETIDILKEQMAFLDSLKLNEKTTPESKETS